MPTDAPLSLCDDPVQQPCVLIVDDDSVVVDVAAEALRRIGCQVLVAADGREALELYGQVLHNIDLLLADLVMPEMGGAALLAEMRKRGFDRHVLFMTAYREPEWVAFLRTTGTGDYIQKPWRMAELRAAVRSALEG